uniref:Uncharacterized protein n=1 Tax=Opuntia streptacantha TaxID=393608 RepID=A0A7C8Z6K6_OPUST
MLYSQVEAQNKKRDNYRSVLLISMEQSDGTILVDNRWFNIPRRGYLIMTHLLGLHRFVGVYFLMQLLMYSSYFVSFIFFLLNGREEILTVSFFISLQFFFLKKT